MTGTIDAWADMGAWPRGRRRLRALAFGAAVLAAPTVADAHDRRGAASHAAPARPGIAAPDPAADDGGFDTEHLFGFADGSDIGAPGEPELESDTTGRIGNRHGSFSGIDSAVSLKVPVNEQLRLSPGFTLSRYDVSGLPGAADRAMGAIDGAFLEMRVRLLERGTSPFGLTIRATPSFGSVDVKAGLRNRGYGADFALLADKEIIPDKLVAVLNLSYGMGSARLLGSGEVTRAAGVDITAGLSYRIAAHVFAGSEVRYARAYGNLGLDRFTGHAAFVGPTLYTTLGTHAWASVAWHVQVAGNGRGDGRHLDLDQFDRHQVRLRVGYHF